MFEITDGHKVWIFNGDQLPAMRWVFLTETLIGLVSHCDDELELVLKIATGLETSSGDEKGTQLTSKLIKGVMKALSHYSDTKKKEIYDRIFEGFTTKTTEGGVLFVTCDTLDAILTKPSNFYIIVYNCLKERYAHFFTEAVDTLKSLNVSDGTVV